MPRARGVSWAPPDVLDAGDFYYAEMELRRTQLGRIRGTLLWLYWLVCGYGEKPVRALIVFCCLWLVFASGFTRTRFTLAQQVSWRAADGSLRSDLKGSEVKAHEAKEPKVAFAPLWSEALEHSIRSLTLQQRDGYLAPHTPWANNLTLAANGLGPIQLGLFFLAIRRRFRR